MYLMEEYRLKVKRKHHFTGYAYMKKTDKDKKKEDTHSYRYKTVMDYFVEGGRVGRLRGRLGLGRGMELPRFGNTGR